jgi:hypothetical protein
MGLPNAPTHPSARRGTSWFTPLALCSLGAAAIHFGVLGEHLDEALAFGIFFAVVGWAQALWSTGILLAPGRRLVLAGLVGNLTLIAVWALSRTVGVPVGPEPWTREELGASDLTATFLELLVVIGCSVVLVRGTDRSARSRVRAGPVMIAGLTVAVLTGVAIGAGTGHVHTAERAHDHGVTEADGSLAPHTHRSRGGSGEPDLLQIDQISEAMQPYEDVRVAMAEGWRKEHRDWPELGAHFYREGDWAGSFPDRGGVDILDPEFLMYSRYLTERWQLVAVAYVVDQARYPDPPTELTGAIYHEHVWNCIADGEELEEEDWGVLSPEECEILDGEWSPGAVWMTHVWLVDNPNGIFAETNPTLTPLR